MLKMQVNQSRYKDNKMTEQVKQEPTQEAKEAMGVSDNAVQISSVDEMGHIVTNWHYTVVQDFHHKLRMPEDVGIDIPTGDIDEDGNEVVIDGNADHKAGFLAGLHYALERMDSFPVKGVPEDEEN